MLEKVYIHIVMYIYYVGKNLYAVEMFTSYVGNILYTYCNVHILCWKKFICC